MGSVALFVACLTGGIAAAVASDSGQTRVCPAKCLPASGACLVVVDNRVCVDSDQDGDCDFTTTGNCPD